VRKNKKGRKNEQQTGGLGDERGSDMPSASMLRNETPKKRERKGGLCVETKKRLNRSQGKKEPMAVQKLRAEVVKRKKNGFKVNAGK